VGWHQGHLVIGVGINEHPQNSYEGFAYGYGGYHVADATTGNRISTVCDGSATFAPPVPAGIVCTNNGVDKVSDWSGVARVIQGDNGCGGGALSPDGSLIADCRGNPRTVALVTRDGSATPTSIGGAPAGWIDSNHVVIVKDTDSSLGILDSRSLALNPIQAQGFFAGSIPGGL